MVGAAEVVGAGEYGGVVDGAYETETLSEVASMDDCDGLLAAALVSWNPIPTVTAAPIVAMRMRCMFPPKNSTTPRNSVVVD